MKSILVFNNMNDLIYWKWNHLFVKHVLNLARGQGLIPAEKEKDEDMRYSGELNPDVVIQIFSPIITSQKIMSCQFGNSYTSVQCRDGTNIVFDEYVGYLLVHIGRESVCRMQRNLATCISIIKYFCGPDPSFLKHDKQKSGVDMAMDSWQRLVERDQATLLGSVESLETGTEVSSTAMGALKAALGALPHPPRPAHAALFVKNTMLALYTCRSTEDLSPMDVLFLGVMCSGAQDSWSRRPPTSGSRSPTPTDSEEDIVECGDYGQTLSWMVIFGSGAPFSLHLRRLSGGITLALAIGGSGNAASSISAALIALAGVALPLSQRDVDNVKPALATLDASMKKALDSLKKHKSQPDSPQRKLQSHWDSLRKKTSELSRGGWAGAEAGLCPLRLALRTAYQLHCGGFSPTTGDTAASFEAVHARLDHIYDFLRVKAMRNFTLGSSPAMSKYIEEFPGLVHFLHLDRTNHRLTAPALSDCSQMLSRKKIWQMVERGCSNVRNGHLATMWKDGSLHYAHLVWWEDTSGAPLKPKHLSHSTLPPNNVTPMEYINRLTDACFPGAGPASSRGIRCWELYAIHLGLLPAGTALAHARRLAATVSDLRAPSNPAVGLL